MGSPLPVTKKQLPAAPQEVVPTLHLHPQVPQASSVDSEKTA